MTERGVKYAGYRFGAKGIYLRKKLRYQWAELSVIATRLHPDRKGYSSQLVFKVGGSLIFGSPRFITFGSGMGRYAEALAVACQQAPVEAEVDELTRDIARWGTREMRHTTKARTGERLDAEKKVARVQNQRAWVEHKKALKTVSRTLAWQPDHPDALRLRLLLLQETDAKPTKLWQAAEDWARQYPENPEAQTARAIAGLANEMPVIVEEVEHRLARKPDQLDLTVALSAYHFRKKNYEGALRVWETFASVAADPDEARVAQENVTYLRDYSGSVSFRWRERIKGWAAVGLACLPIALFLGFQIYRVYREWNPEDQVVSPEVVKMREEIDQEMERLDREYQKMTGRISVSNEVLIQRAEAGAAAAQYTLATDLIRTNDQDEVKRGIGYLEQSAAQDYRWAVLALAEYLDEGKFVAQDVPRAVTLFERAAELGSPRAARMAGEHYFRGEGVPVDKAKAFQFFQKSAEGGHTAGIAWTGFMLEQGEGVEADFEEAIHYYQQAAENEDGWTMQRLFSLYFMNQDETFDRAEMEAWLWRAAEVGSPQFKLYAATWLLQNQDRPGEEISRIVTWLDGEIEKGNTEAIFMRGVLAWDGVLGTIDRADAIQWFELAAEKNYAPALHQLARSYAFGVGVERDPAKATKWRDRFAAAKEKAPSLHVLDDALKAASRDFLEKVPAEQTSAPVWRTPPKYPYALRAAGVTGSAQIRFKVNVDGFTEDVRVVKATELAFGIAALDAVLFWRFEPRVESKTMEVPIIFTLNDRPAEDSAAEGEEISAITID